VQFIKGNGTLLNQLMQCCNMSTWWEPSKFVLSAN